MMRRALLTTTVRLSTLGTPTLGTPTLGVPLLVCVTLLLALVFTVRTTNALLAAPDDERIREAMERVYEANDYQTTLPKLEEREPPEPRISLFPLGQILLYLLVAVLATIIIILIAKYFTRPREKEDVAPPERRAQVSERPLGDAEALAREGRFGEAIHVLLLKTIEELRESLEFVPAPSLTSREIQVLAPLDVRSRGTLGELIHEVEISYFGKFPVEKAEYERCVALFRRFIEQCREGA